MLLRLLYRNPRLEPFVLLPDNQRRIIMAKHKRISKVEHVGKKRGGKKRGGKKHSKKSMLKK
jgi:hypothetical protein